MTDSPTFLDWWAKHDDGSAAAGGFYRADTLTEAVDAYLDMTSRGLAVRCARDLRLAAAASTFVRGTDDR